MKFYLNNQEVTPDNLFEIGLASDFTENPNELRIDTDRVRLPREGLGIVQNWIAQNGLFQGIPAQVVTKDGTTIEYYADLYDPTTKPVFKTYSVELKLKRRWGKDNFFDRANGLTFDAMAAAGVQFDLVDIPYVIIKDNAEEMALSIAIALYTMTKELIEQIIELTETIILITQASIPVVGIGFIIELIAKAVLQLIVIGLLLFAIIKLAQQFFELIFPKVRFFQGCKVKELMLKGAQYLGFQFESNLLDAIPGLTILPKPLVKDKDSIWDKIQNDLNFAFTKGYPTSSDQQISTLKRVFDAMELTFNGRTLVRNGVVQFERRDFWQNLISQTVQPALNIQADRREEWSYNTEEAWKRYFPNYQTDPGDLHTLDFFDPTVAEYSTEILNVINDDLAIVKGLDDVTIPFALGVRKNDLNWLEKLAKEFFQTIDQVVNAFGGNGTYAAQIDERKGVLQISQQFFTVPKLMYTINGKQPQDYEDIIGATAIYNAYHQINEITQNGFKVYKDVPIRITPSEFVNLIDNNYVEINGLACEILTIQYFDEQSRAVISYKEPFDYATGFVEIVKID